MKPRPTLLLADDSESDLFLLRRAFKKAEFDIPLSEVHDGQETIAYLEGTGAYADRSAFPLPAVLFLDLNMPKVNGFEVLQWLRGKAGIKRLTVVVLTSSMREEDAERASELGANWFVVKPSSLEDLVALIRALRDWMRFAEFPSLKEAPTR